MEILALVFGLIASAFVVSLSIVKNQKTIALISMLMNAVLMGQYFALDQLTAVALSAMSMLYGILIFATLGRTDSFSKGANSTAVRVGLLVAYTAVFMMLNGGLGWNIQLLAYIGSMLMVAVMMVSNAWAVKLILLAAGICWTAFQFQTGAYGNLVGQVFYFSGLIWSSWKLWSSRSEPVALAIPAPKLQST